MGPRCFRVGPRGFPKILCSTVWGPGGQPSPLDFLAGFLKNPTHPQKTRKLVFQKSPQKPILKNQRILGFLCFFGGSFVVLCVFCGFCGFFVNGVSQENTFCVHGRQKEHSKVSEFSSPDAPGTVVPTYAKKKNHVYFWSVLWHFVIS